jgi:CDP-diacylglycerol--inositol 3-phosphatidyltransferase
MSSARTRRQAAAISTPTTPSPAPREEQVVMNGNGTAHGAVREKQPKENIFLFWPNIIGQLLFAEVSDIITDHV